MTWYPFNFNWIEEGKILAGSMPTGGEDLITLKNMGVTHILSLTRRHLNECESIAQVSAEFDIFHCPIVDANIPDDTTALKAVDYMDQCYQAGRPFYLHCRGGVGRTGLLLDAYYIWRRGLTVESARPFLQRRHCPYTGNYAGAGGSPQTEWVTALEGNKR